MQKHIVYLRIRIETVAKQPHLENATNARDPGTSIVASALRCLCSLLENILLAHAHVNGGRMITRLGEKVRRLREQAALTQTELAQQAGLSSRGYISDVEKGKKIPPAERILKLAMIFHVTTDYLLRDDLDTPEGNA